MDFVFVDRESAYPNRYLLIPESGENTYVLLERADEVVTPGTPLNAETFNAMVAEINKKAPNVAYKFSAAFAATNPAPTDLWDIDIKDANLDGSSNMWNSYVVADKATSLTNCPVTSGAFHAFRTVETNPAGDFLVTLREVYPTLGRVWTAKYSGGSWEGWVANYPGDLKAMLAAGNTILSSYQYGYELPPAGTAGRLFFKVVE